LAGALPIEFDRIARHFAPLAGTGAFGLTDDAACLIPPPGEDLVITADAVVAGVHFLVDDPPEMVARKLLRVNLSDLAAKGARPLGYLLTVSVPANTPEAWFVAFAQGLAQDQSLFGMSLLGGDTTSTPGPVSLSATVIGCVRHGGMVRRAGARPGDGIFVSGSIGDGALGLLAAQGRLADPTGFLTGRYRLPQPRIGLVDADDVRAAMDVSDGLVQDLGHLCRAGAVSAAVEAELVPCSEAARALGADWLATRLTGGDDYEVLLAVAPEAEATVRQRADLAGVALTRIGSFGSAGPGPAVVVRHSGVPMAFGAGGWSHF